MAYVHYAGSGKKRLQYSSVCSALGEDEQELVSLHGIRWRESTHRAAKNLLRSWHARVTNFKLAGGGTGGDRFQAVADERARGFSQYDVP